jgi:hypothetical protein
MRKIISISLFICVCISCSNKDEEVACQKLRHQYFIECLEKIPEGPTSISNSNDWAEVVSECGNQSYYQSIIPRHECESTGGEDEK